jgi:pimeloyl-ACP methyl ester carboxylesterase
LLLIAGLGLDGSSWWRSVVGFAERFRVYRGLGRSGRAPLYSTTDDLADDAAAVLDAAEVESGLVYGLSLGGMAAQRLVLSHPGRVSANVLGATRADGDGVVRPGPATVANLCGMAASAASPGESNQSRMRATWAIPRGVALALDRGYACSPASSDWALMAAAL